MIAEQLPLLSHDLPPLNLHDRVRTPEGCFSTIHRVGRVATRAGARCVHCWHCFSTIHRVGRVATTIVRSRPDEAIGVSVPSTDGRVFLETRLLSETACELRTDLIEVPAVFSPPATEVASRFTERRLRSTTEAPSPGTPALNAPVLFVPAAQYCAPRLRLYRAVRHTRHSATRARVALSLREARHTRYIAATCYAR